MSYLMEERKEDPRIFIISGLMFLCVICGGLLLSLYLFLPESQSNDWYSVVGIALVATPWIFWFLVYLYHCFKPVTKVQFSGYTTSSSNKAPPSKSSGGGATIVANLPEVESPVSDSPGGGKRRVHFGAVVVNENQPQVGRNSHESPTKEPTNAALSSRESEAPLRSSSSSSSLSS